SKTVSTASALEVWQVKPGSVYDGDTLRVIKGNQELKIRFACTDSPELKQDKGIAARDHLRSLLNRANNQVKINPVDTDRYGRTVAEIYTTSGGRRDTCKMGHVVKFCKQRQLKPLICSRF
ncbi:MAG: thermonuclease family protein, partial [Microcystaceae cyanobacterium]